MSMTMRWSVLASAVLLAVAGLLVPVAFGCIFLGRIVTIVFLTVAAVAGFKEFARATGLYRDWIMTGAVYLGILATGIISVGVCLGLLGGLGLAFLADFTDKTFRSAEEIRRRLDLPVVAHIPLIQAKAAADRFATAAELAEALAAYAGSTLPRATPVPGSSW